MYGTPDAHARKPSEDSFDPLKLALMLPVGEGWRRTSAHKVTARRPRPPLLRRHLRRDVFAIDLFGEHVAVDDRADDRRVRVIVRDDQHVDGLTVRTGEDERKLAVAVRARLDDGVVAVADGVDRKSTRLNSSHLVISY